MFFSFIFSALLNFTVAKYKWSFLWNQEKLRKKLSYKFQDSFVRLCSWFFYFFFVWFFHLFFQESFCMPFGFFSSITFSHFLSPPFNVFFVCFVSVDILWFSFVNSMSSFFILSINKYIIGKIPQVLNMKIHINRVISHFFQDLYRAIHFHVMSQANRKARNGDNVFSMINFGIKSIFTT